MKKLIENQKGIIFDLDGTLLDSMGIWKKIDIDFLGKRGFEVPGDYQAAITPLGARAAAVYTIERFGLTDETPESLMEEWMEMAYEAYSDRLELKPFAYETVKNYYEQGMKIGIASSSDYRLVKAAVDKNGLSGYIKTIVTSADVSRGKGFPDIYLECSRRLGLEPSECVVFEDIIEGIRGAKKGRFFTVGVEEPANASTKEDVMCEADLFISSFREL